MKLDKESREDLIREKNLWDIYRVSRKIPHSKFNFAVASGAAIILVVYVLLSKDQPSELKNQVLKLSELVFGFALNVLGFLLAGFTIFATISKPGLLLEMQKRQHPKYGMSWLKYNYCVFFRVFIYYLAFAGFCAGLLVLGQSSSAWRILFGDDDIGRFAKSLLLKTSFVVIGGGWAVLLLSLKSFIFNIYHVVMTALRWEAEGLDKKD